MFYILQNLMNVLIIKKTWIYFLITSMTHIRTYTHTHTHAHIYTYIHACMHVCNYTNYTNYANLEKAF